MLNPIRTQSIDQIAHYLILSALMIATLAIDHIDCFSATEILKASEIDFCFLF